MAIDLRFITGIRWYKDLMETLNNMTFFLDPSWDVNNSAKATFPVCFFHVKSFHEVMNTEISQKQMLFFNSTVGANSSDPTIAKQNDPATDSGLLNVVADNIVVKPKVYKLEVVIPYRNLTLLYQSFTYNTHTAQAMASAVMTHNDKKKDRTLGAMSTLSQPYFTLLKTVLNALISTDLTWTEGRLEDWLSSTVQQPDYNKESLEIMWRMRHIIKMKVWNSWQYKYVAINDIDITKEGTEDGVYEATITVQEMPIVTMYAQGAKSGITQFAHKNPLLKRRGEVAISALNSASGLLGKVQ